MNISYSIMAHPAREVEAYSIAAQLVDQGVESVPLSFDSGDGITANCRSAWEMRDLLSDVHFVLQDDAVLCRNFVKRVEAMVHSNPTNAYSLYMGRKDSLRGAQAQALRLGYWLGPLRWGVAVGLRTKLVPAMLEFYDKQTGNKDDDRIKKFLASRSLRVYYPVPSLVEHALGVSLVGDPGTNRVAYRFIDDEVV